MLKKAITFTLFSLLTLLLITGCTPSNSTDSDSNNQQSNSGNPTGTNTITGRITVRNMIDYIDLPEGSHINVSLLDISLADAPANVTSEAVYRNETQLPIEYALTFDPAQIEQGLNYAIQVLINDSNGNLLFINDTVHPALTQGAGTEVDVELIMVDQPEAETETSSMLEGSQWKLQTLGQGDEQINLVEGAEPTLNFEDGMVHGLAGCNNYFGPFTLEENKLSFGSLGATLMMCEEELMEIEAAFLESLEAVQSYSILENMMTLQLKDGSMLVFEPIDSSE